MPETTDDREPLHPLWHTVFALSLVALAIGFWRVPVPIPFVRSKMERYHDIEVGMHFDEVAKILGPSAVFGYEEDPPPTWFGRHWDWEYRIQVEFDGAERVISKKLF